MCLGFVRRHCWDGSCLKLSPFLACLITCRELGVSIDIEKASGRYYLQSDRVSEE